MNLLRKQRIFYALFLMLIVFAAIIIRLAYIQFIQVNHHLDHSERTMLQMSVLQREQGIVLDSGRGQFIDRNHKPITGQLIWIPVLFPLEDKLNAEQEQQHRKLAHILNIDSSELWEKWRSLHSPEYWQSSTGEPVVLSEAQIEAIRQLQLEDVQALPYMDRYSALKENGMQWLGYLSEMPDAEKPVVKLEVKDPFNVKTGAAGLERSLEPLLKGLGPTIVSNMVDSHKKPVEGMGPRLIAPHNPKYPLHIQTTIDLSLQQKLEQLTTEAKVNEGAVVVLDADHAEVRAMVSRPFYHPTDIHLDEGSSVNQATMAAVPGSIFKLVTAAAALEQGAVSSTETFHCSGHYGKYGLACWKKEGHGTITFEEAFAGSCNVAFAEVASRLTSSQLLQAAHALGLGQQVGYHREHYLGLQDFRMFDHEDAGEVFHTADMLKQNDEGIRIQTAIGQRDVKITPLQAANMIVTVLHGGQLLSPKLVSEIHYADGKLLAEIKDQSLIPSGKLAASSIQIHSSTAKQLRSYMEQVVEEGTGIRLQQAIWPLAGKSGTAQVLHNGVEKNNQWFIGYGPVNHPKYAVAVLVKNESVHSQHKATALFQQVMDVLAGTSD